MQARLQSIFEAQYELKLEEKVEIRTRKETRVGERGVLAITDLHNYAMPRLRYLLADVLSIAQDPCACGRGLPVAANDALSPWTQLGIQ